MKRFFEHLLFVVLVLGLNYSSQNLLQGKSLDLGILKLSPVFNNAFIFGLFPEVSSMLRIVLISVSMGIGSLVACYFYAFLNPELKRLRWGMTITLAGILGNGLEKLLYGYVWDFITIDVGWASRFTFNLNDVLQILGFLIICREVFRQQDQIWFPSINGKRKRLIVYRDIQFTILFRILGITFVANLTQAALVVGLLFPDLKRGSQDTQVLFLSCLLLLNLILMPLLGMFLLKELLRCLGPIFALETYIKNGSLQNSELKFRKTDHFHSLAHAMNELLAKLKAK